MDESFNSEATDLARPTCPRCNGRAVKNGKQNNRQRLRCKSCGKRFQLHYTYKAYESSTNNLIRMLLKEGCGIRSISRILGIATTTVLSRMLALSRQINAHCSAKFQTLQNIGAKYEVDELFVRISNGHYQNWLAYCIEQKTGRVIDFVVSHARSKEQIEPMINKLLLLKPAMIYTDKLNIYPSIIPGPIHRVFKYCTNRIERKNLTLRTHVKRLSRKTICFTKNQKYLEAHLRIYFWS